MKKFISILVLAFVMVTSYAQERMLEAESAVTTKHTVTVKNKLIPYSATSGTLPVWDKDGKVIASLFHTYYKRSDIKNDANRPLIISFNGGLWS